MSLKARLAEEASLRKTDGAGSDWSRTLTSWCGETSYVQYGGNPPPTFGADMTIDEYVEIPGVDDIMTKVRARVALLACSDCCCRRALFRTLFEYFYFPVSHVSRLHILWCRMPCSYARTCSCGGWLAMSFLYLFCSSFGCAELQFYFNRDWDSVWHGGLCAGAARPLKYRPGGWEEFHHWQANAGVGALMEYQV